MPVKTGFVQRHAGYKDKPPFGFNLCPDPGKHPNDRDEGDAHDTLYSSQRRNRGPEVPEQKYIEVTYVESEGTDRPFLNVESWREVAAPEGQPSEEKVKEKWQDETQETRNSIHRSVALQQAVAFVVGENAPKSYPFQVEDSFYLFLSLLDGTHKVTREPGTEGNDTLRAPKPVAEKDPPRDAEGYIVRASEADRSSQDEQGPPPVTDPADPKFVRTGASA